MSANIRSVVGKIGSLLLATGDFGAGQAAPLDMVVEEARQEWLNACAYFDTVSDPDLVDRAIYMIEAAERKYMYLLRKVKQERPPVQPGLIT